MEDQINGFAAKVWSKFIKIPSTERYLIAISGIPGSGKTTLAIALTRRLNAFAAGEYENTEITATASFLPMDGFHLSKAQLDSMPDPKYAHDRRGAAFTFDCGAFTHLLKKLREPISRGTPTIWAPSFNHALQDPVNDDIPIPSTSRIVVIEGNYLSLNKGPWKEVRKLVDESWFLEVDFEVAGERLATRHVKAGIANDEISAWKRVRENDLVNGKEIVDFRGSVNEIVTSRDDARFAPGNDV